MVFLGTNKDTVCTLQVVLKIKYLRAHSLCSSRVKIRKTDKHTAVSSVEGAANVSPGSRSLANLSPQGFADYCSSGTCLFSRSLSFFLPFLLYPRLLGAGQVHSSCPGPSLRSPNMSGCCRKRSEFGTNPAAKFLGAVRSVISLLFTSRSSAVSRFLLTLVLLTG